MSDGRSICEQLESRTLFSLSTIPLPAGDVVSELAAGPASTMWALDAQHAKILKIPASGPTRQFSLGRRHHLTLLTAGPDGNMWFADDLGGVSSFIGRITPKGRVREFRIPGKLRAVKLVAGPANRLWFIPAGSGPYPAFAPSLVFSVTPSGRIHKYQLDAVQPIEDTLGCLISGPGNTLIFNADAYLPIGRGIQAYWFTINPAGQVTEQTQSDDGPVLRTPGGTVWAAYNSPAGYNSTIAAEHVAEFAGGLDVYNTVTFKTLLNGPDDHVWYVDTAGGIGYMTSDGQLIAGRLPSGMPVSAMALSADGKFWASDGTSSSLSIFDPSNAILAGGVTGSILPGATQTVTLANIKDLRVNAKVSDLSATITWSDYTISPGVITAGGAGGFTLSGSRAFTNVVDGEAFLESFTVTDSVTGQTATATAKLTNVYPPPSITGINISAVAGQTFQGHIAHVTGVDMNTLSLYTMRIDWGDETTSTGTLVDDGAGGAYVVASHRYANAGLFYITSGIADPPSASGVGEDKTAATAQATVS